VTAAWSAMQHPPWLVATEVLAETQEKER